jgi:hypothetical protein
MVRALRKHWPEYLMEAALLGLFMVSACAFTVLLDYTNSPIHQASSSAACRCVTHGLAKRKSHAAWSRLVPDPYLRRATYSPHFTSQISATLATIHITPIASAELPTCSATTIRSSWRL